jgi:glycogen debranching enzyme
MEAHVKETVATRVLCLLIGLTSLIAGCSGGSSDSSVPISGETLSFEMQAGGQTNEFFRQGNVAAHLLMRSSTKPRLLVVFPAGNSGTGLWFQDTAQPVNWSLDTAISPVVDHDSRGRALYGIAANVSVDVPQLTLRGALLTSVRFMRDFNGGYPAPTAVQTQPTVSGNVIHWQRDRADGAAGYEMTVQVTGGGTVSTDATGALVLKAANGSGSLHLNVLSYTGETPLTPITHADLFNNTVNPDTQSQNVVEFLSYDDKLLAGSWQYDTYFGRDTLISVRMLMPVLQPPAIEAGLTAVLSRLSPDGIVAHEEGIGEFAVIDNEKNGRGNDATPTYDYKMIDGDYLLAPVMAAWLIDDPRGAARAAAYLAQTEDGGQTNGSRFVTNLVHVADTARAFSQQSIASNLIHLRAGQIVGNWRDSTDGLAGGVYPYDVNAVLVPAALRAASRFVASGLLDPYITSDQRTALADAAQQASVWESAAGALFEVSVPASQAATAVPSYAAQTGVPAGNLPSSTTSFYAVSLDAQGNPIPVMNSDGGFALLLGTPSSDVLTRIVTAAVQPFPVGLVTDAGMLVANPAYADASLWPRFTNAAYHGTVVWSWQQAMWVAGLDRQLARQDLPADVRTLLTNARLRIWQVISNASDMRASEMWTWSYANGAYQAEAFGTHSADATEANAAQLWSTTYLAITDPNLRVSKFWWQARNNGMEARIAGR